MEQKRCSSLPSDPLAADTLHSLKLAKQACNSVLLSFSLPLSLSLSLFLSLTHTHTHTHTADTFTLSMCLPVAFFFFLQGSGWNASSFSGRKTGRQEEEEEREESATSSFPGITSRSDRVLRASQANTHTHDSHPHTVFVPKRL